MTVQELQEKLDLIDSECEVLVIDDQYCVHGIEDARLEERVGEIKVVDTVKEYYENETKRLQNMIEYATKRLKMIEDKTLEVEY